MRQWRPAILSRNWYKQAKAHLTGEVTMEKDRKTAITNAEIDAMTNEELLRLANDLKYSAMNAQHYGTSSRKLKEIGVMLGELIEEVKAKK